MPDRPLLPRSEAGKRLVDHSMRWVVQDSESIPVNQTGMARIIAAIEAEVVAAEREEVRHLLAEHRKCGKPYAGCYSHFPSMPHCRACGMAWPCDCAAVLALLDDPA